MSLAQHPIQNLQFVLIYKIKSIETKSSNKFPKQQSTISNLTYTKHNTQTLILCIKLTLLIGYDMGKNSHKRTWTIGAIVAPTVKPQRVQTACGIICLGKTPAYECKNTPKRADPFSNKQYLNQFKDHNLAKKENQSHRYQDRRPWRHKPVQKYRKSLQQRES